MIYPVGLNMQGKVCLVVGGGAVAERKVKALLKLVDCRIIIIAPVMTAELERLADEGRISRQEQAYEQGLLADLYSRLLKEGKLNTGDFVLVFVATDNADINRQVAVDARREGICTLINVADKSSESDFEVPAHVRRGDILFTVSTGGKSPALSKALRQELERAFPEELADWLERVAQVRQLLQESLADSGKRQEFWQTAFSEEIVRLVRAGKIAEAEVELRNAAFNAGIKP